MNPQPVTGWITDRDDPRLTDALSRTCDLCGADKHTLCSNPILPNRPLPGGRLVHTARTLDRNRK